MPSATPDTLGDVLGQIIQESARQAAAAPEQLTNWFQQLGDEVGGLADDAKRAPAHLLDKLEDLVDPPDWWSLLVLLLVQVSKLDDRLSLGVMQPPGWSRTVTLTFTGGPGAVTAGLALTDPDLIHGFLLRSTAAVDSGSMAVGPLALSVKTSGAVRWEIPFAGPLVRPESPAVIDATISWDPGVEAREGPASFSLGKARVTVRLSSVPGEPLYTVILALGEEDGTAGAEAKVDIGAPLGGLVRIDPIGESYSPQLVLTQNTAPRFTLGHRGIS